MIGKEPGKELRPQELRPQAVEWWEQEQKDQLELLTALLALSKPRHSLQAMLQAMHMIHR
jgi:hypothetical protein